MNDTNATRLHVLVSASVAGVLCALLLGLSAGVVQLRLAGVVVGLLLGAVLGVGALSGRVSLTFVGAVFGGLAGLILAFGYQDGEIGANLHTIGYGAAWLSGLVIILASIGGAWGLSHKKQQLGLTRALIAPTGAVVSVACAFSWDELRERAAFYQPYWGNELVVASLAAIVLHLPLYRVCRRQTGDPDRTLFWAAWVCWPWLVALTYSLLWMLNHAGGHHAIEQMRGAAIFMLGLLVLALISNVAVAVRHRHVIESSDVFTTLGRIFLVTILQILSSIFFRFSMIRAYV